MYQKRKVEMKSGAEGGEMTPIIGKKKKCERVSAKKKT